MTRTPGEIAGALAVLAEAGCEIVAPRPRVRLFSMQATAEALGVSVRWVRDHLEEFPGAINIGYGTRREVRIPEGDLLAFVGRRRFLLK